MNVTYRYINPSSVSSDASQTQLAFSPDTLRPPSFFVGELKQNIAFREAISALHDVVISDMRVQPKDRDAYFSWLAEEEQRLLAEHLAQQSSIKTLVQGLRRKIADMNRQSSKILQPFYQAQRRYFKYLYKRDLDAWYVLDPVITVHPDEVFFECFSEDESSYGKLSCSYNVFNHISDTECGTTNIDYSQGLYNEFQKIRDYRKTTLKIDPDGFSIASDGAQGFEEKKIDLPDSWVRGFLQVSSAMTLPLTSVDLHPMDIHNICHTLRRHKERVGPRAMRFTLEPGKPVVIHFEPWNHQLVCHRSIYQGDQQQQIRVWGRRRIHILERLIPVANAFTLYLIGDGLPCFYIADLGDMSFTLGLSGWTANDWARMGNFDLLAPRGHIDAHTSQRVYQALKKNWVASAAQLASDTQLDEKSIKTALAQYSQQGLVLFDLASQQYRIRELSREELPLEALRFANPREEKSSAFVSANLVTITDDNAWETYLDGGRELRGTVLDNAVVYHAEITIDRDNRMAEGHCHCHFFHENNMRKGPCEHMLALRLAAQKGALQR
jgi:hypothetical protein